MKIKFYGGVKEVTGSNFLIESGDKKILIDCGLIQGACACELTNFEPFFYNPQEIDLVLITHSHIDHIGRLPKLIKDGFNGKILSTLPTKELAKEVLPDSLHIIKEEHNRELFSEKDIEKAMELWETISYHQIFELNGLSIELFDAGHILGSAFIKITQKDKSIIFSGDLGNSPNPILKDTEELPETNYLVIDSTYGDRNHEDFEIRKELLEDILEDTIKNKGVLIIPAFAIERTQEILFDIDDLIENSKIPILPIFLNSPLGLKITETYQRYPEYFNEYAKKKLVYEKQFGYPNLHLIKDTGDEKKIFDSSHPKIIIAGSGMLTGGRILNLLKRYISKSDTILLFIGYQAKDSLGRKILDGEKNIQIDGEKLTVNARIKKLLSYSAHKDQDEILKWTSPQKRFLKKIFLVHGDEEVKRALKIKITDDLGISAEIPRENAEFDLN